MKWTSLKWKWTTGADHMLATVNQTSLCYHVQKELLICTYNILKCENANSHSSACQSTGMQNKYLLSWDGCFVIQGLWLCTLLSKDCTLSTWKLSENFDWYPKYLGPHNVQICKKKVYNLSPNLELCKRAVNTKVSTCSIRHVSSAMRAKLLEGHSAWEGADLTVLPPASATIAAAFRLGDRVPVAWSNLTHTL